MKILRLNLAGQPINWLDWEAAVCMYASDLVVWSMGDVVRNVRGGISRLSGQRSIVELPSIIACGGEQMARPRMSYPLTNPTQFCPRRPSVYVLRTAIYTDSAYPRSHFADLPWRHGPLGKRGMRLPPLQSI